MNSQHDAQNAIAIVMGLNILLGLVLCFSGYLVSRMRTALGALLGFVMAANIGFSVSQSAWMALIAGIIGAVIGALVSTVFYLLGLFLIGAMLGGFLSSTIMGFITHSDPQPWIVSLSAIAGGGIVLLFRKLRIGVVLIATAMGGAALILFGILCLGMAEANGVLLWPDIFSNHGKLFSYLMSFGWIALAVSGVIVQYRILPESAKADLKPASNHPRNDSTAV